jgi:hypothetical protein
MNLPIVVLILFLGTPLAALASRFGRIWAAWAAGLLAALALALLIPTMWEVFASGEAAVKTIPWVPKLGLNLAFRMDGLGLLFSILILVIGVLVILYARYYLGEKDCTGRFFAYLLLFMGSMLGVVLAENILLLLMFWEMTSLSSFLLISYWEHRSDARNGARMALTITGLGGLALLGRLSVAGAHRRQLRAVGHPDPGRCHPRARALPADPGADPAGGLHQVGAVPVPLLAAAGHGGADAGIGLPALGDAGEGRCVPVGAVLPGAIRNPGVVLHRHGHRAGDAAGGGLLRPLPA